MIELILALLLGIWPAGNKNEHKPSNGPIITMNEGGGGGGHTHPPPPPPPPPDPEEP